MSSYALLVVDMQKAYFNNDTLERQRPTLVASCNDLVAQTMQRNLPVINIVTQHQRDTTTWTLNMLDDGEGYLYEGDDDTAIIDGLELAGATTVVKTRDSAFYQTELEQLLHTQNVDTVILAGVSTHGCIMQTAADAYAHNFRVILAREAIASHDPDFEDMTFRLLAQEYRQKVCTNKEIMNMIGSQS